MSNNVSIYKKKILDSTPMTQVCLKASLRKEISLYDPLFFLYANDQIDRSSVGPAKSYMKKTLATQALSWLAGGAETFFCGLGVLSLAKGSLSGTVAFALMCYLINEAEKFAQGQIKLYFSYRANVVEAVQDICENTPIAGIVDSWAEDTKKNVMEENSKINNTGRIISNVQHFSESNMIFFKDVVKAFQESERREYHRRR
ncbi:MAG: hypothetical protein SFW66_10125 [Gammaproteobacteria bacterium]|nr:hypothetical protein [Gammaproteobacteria bacterium]